MRGFFGIGIYHVKTGVNIGTLWRSAQTFGASWLYTIGKRYKQESSDTTKASRHIPLYHYLTLDDFYAYLPHDCQIIGVELSSTSFDLRGFFHPERCCYLLGAEDCGLPQSVLEHCHSVIQIPTEKEFCLNVAVAGSIIMYDRFVKRTRFSSPFSSENRKNFSPSFA